MYNISRLLSGNVIWLFKEAPFDGLTVASTKYGNIVIIKLLLWTEYK